MIEGIPSVGYTMVRVICAAHTGMAARLVPVNAETLAPLKPERFWSIPQIAFDRVDFCPYPGASFDLTVHNAGDNEIEVLSVADVRPMTPPASD